MWTNYQKSRSYCHLVLRHSLLLIDCDFRTKNVLNNPYHGKIFCLLAKQLKVLFLYNIGFQQNLQASGFRSSAVAAKPLIEEFFSCVPFLLVMRPPLVFFRRFTYTQQSFSHFRIYLIRKKCNI